MFVLRRIIILLLPVIWIIGLELVRNNHGWLWWTMVVFLLYLVLAVFMLGQVRLKQSFFQFLIMPVVFSTASFTFMLFLVDTWEESKILRPPHEDPNLWYDDHFDSVSEIFEEEIVNGRVILHKQATTTFLASLPDSYLDWVYIDANHHYQFVKRDIDLSIKKVKSGGFIMGHDYMSNPRVWGVSIIRAVNERIQNGDIKMEAITNEKWPSYLTRVL